MRDIKFELNEIEYKIPHILSIGNYAKIFKIKGLFEDDYFATKLINIMTGADVKDLDAAPRDEIQFITNQLMKLIPVEKPSFSDRFTLDGVEYGFIPEWKKMSFGEYADLDTLMTKKPEEMIDYLHIITAILYRPIIKSKSSHKFTIEKYNQDTMEERAELFKEKLDVEYALGAQFFFIQFALNFSNFTPMSLIQKMKREWNGIKFAWRNRKKLWSLLLKRDLDGTQFSIELQLMILQDTMKLSQKVLSKYSTNSATSSKKTKS
jgi:hypothetical protein